MSRQAFLHLFLVAFASLPTSAFADRAAADRGVAEFEATFLMQIADHHLEALNTGQLCTTKATRQELRALCQEMVTSQGEEIRMIQGWLRDWYSVSYSPKVSPRGEQNISRLAGLSGANFETEFMEMMITHHRMAIMRAGECFDRADHDALDDMCEDMVVAQGKEIEKMRTWLCEWHRRCQR